MPSSPSAPERAAGEPPLAAAPAPRWWRPGLVALAAVAAAVAVACSALVFPYLSTNSDEGSYLTQAESLAAGHLLTPAPSTATSAFRPWLAVQRDDRFVFKFTPAEAGLLGASIFVFGSAVPALAVVAAGTAVLLALLVVALGGSHRAGLLAGALLVLSPAWIVQSGTYLPYLPGLGLLLATTLLGATAAARRRPGWMVAAGAVWGLAFFSRQFDAVLMLAPVAAGTWTGWRRRGADGAEPGATSAAPPLRLLAGAAVAFAVGALPFLVVLGAYDHVATGSVTKLPFNLLESTDTIGFGPHRVQPPDHYLDYTPKAAVHAGILNAGDLVRTVAGSALLVGIAAYGLARERRLPGRWAFLTLVVVWFGGYFFFWGSYAITVLSDVNTYLGPIYYVPALAGVVAAGAVSLDRLERRRPALGRSLGALVLVASIVAAAPVLADDLHRTDQRTAVVGVLDREVPADRPTLLLVDPVQGPYVGHPLAFLRNGPAYDGRRLVAVNDPATDFALLDANPRRRPYFVSLVKIDPKPAVRAVVEPVRRFRAPTVELRFEAPAVPPGWRRTISISRGPHPEVSFPSRATEVALRVTAGPGGVAVTDADGRPQAPTPGSIPSSVVAIRFRDVDPAGRVHDGERRVPVRYVDGTTEVLLPGELFTDGLASRVTVVASNPAG